MGLPITSGLRMPNSPLPSRTPSIRPRPRLCYVAGRCGTTLTSSIAPPTRAENAPPASRAQTVWTPIVQQSKEGDRVGILGLGGLGHMAITFASALGRTVTALSTTSSKEAEARALGAHHFVAHSDQSQLDAIAGTLDFILVTLATQETVDFSKFFPLLRPRGTLCFVGMCPPITADVFTLGFTMNSISTSNTGGRKEMVQMLEFCAERGIGATVKTRPMEEVNACLADLETKKEAVRYVLTQPLPAGAAATKA